MEWTPAIKMVSTSAPPHARAPLVIGSSPNCLKGTLPNKRKEFNLKWTPANKRASASAPRPSPAVIMSPPNSNSNLTVKVKLALRKQGLEEVSSTTLALSSCNLVTITQLIADRYQMNRESYQLKFLDSIDNEVGFVENDSDITKAVIQHENIIQMRLRIEAIHHEQE